VFFTIFSTSTSTSTISSNLSQVVKITKQRYDDYKTRGKATNTFTAYNRQANTD